MKTKMLRTAIGNLQGAIRNGAGKIFKPKTQFGKAPACCYIIELTHYKWITLVIFKRQAGAAHHAFQRIVGYVYR